MKIGTPLSTL